MSFVDIRLTLIKRKRMIGQLGKSRAVSFLIKNGYDVFQEYDGKSPFDLIAHKDGVLERIEVKSTTTRNKVNTGWKVQLKRVRANRSRNRIVNFDPDVIDKLIIYIEPIDSIVMIDSRTIKQKTQMIIFD